MSRGRAARRAVPAAAARAWAWIRVYRRALLGALCGIAAATAMWYGVPAGWDRIAAHPYFAVTALEVDGARRVARDELLRWAGVSLGMSIWEATPELTRRRLLQHPWVRAARVQRDLPHRIAIRVHEREPMAIAAVDGLQYVDREGRLLGPLRDTDSRDYPVITGVDGADRFTPVALRRALQLLRTTRRLPGCEAVSEIHVERERGVTLFPLRTTVAVVLGWGAWREKLARSGRVLAAWEGRVERLAAVDVSFRDQVVLRLREENHPTVVRSAARGLRV